MLSRSIENLPFFNDLGLLALHYVVCVEDNPIFVGEKTAELKTTERLKELLFVLAEKLDPKFSERKSE